MAKKFDIFEEPEPEMFFTDIGISEENIYEIMIFDVTRFERVGAGNDRGYLVFKAKLLSGFDGMNLNEVSAFRFHFPEAAFRIAWHQFKDYPRLEKKKVYDCTLKFKRNTQKKITIIDRQFQEISAGKTEGLL